MNDEATPPEDSSEPTDIVPPPVPSARQRIGPYRLLEKLGEGGMGEVWLAQQQAPIRRKVALKIIKQGMDTKQVVARFAAERQALAMMDHPAIAKVYDAGATPRGRPYFVMEHVKGVPITQHCDRQKLTNKERLNLFTQVCEGVQHAHQKAVIHRDLKPSNVLVSIQDGKPQPKIIDFGVAKATAQLTDKTMHTRLGELIGTLEYMSPEQAEMTADNVDTRTDVYSLGVMLYELLVGVLPFSPAELRRIGFDEARRKIREDQPPKPSMRLTVGGEHFIKVARRRRSELPALQRELATDLDWITMKALDKDRNRRYASPLELAADIVRHLQHEPVQASPPSTFYRARKFTRRHRFGVVIAGLAVMLLAGFAVRERIQANRIAGALDQASQEAETAKQVSEFLVDLFEVSDPSEARGNSITARELLDKAAREIDETLAGQPEVQARLMVTIGRVYTKLGLFDTAHRLLRQAVGEYEDLTGIGHRDSLDAMNALGWVLLRMDRFEEAESLFLNVLDNSTQLLGKGHPTTLKATNNLANVYWWGQSRHDDAEALLREVLRHHEETLGGDHPEALKTIANLVALLGYSERAEEATPMARDLLEVSRRVRGRTHPDTLWAGYTLGWLLRLQKMYSEAEAIYIDILADMETVLGPKHHRTLDIKNSLAIIYQRTERSEEAARLLEEVLRIQQETLGSDKLKTLRTLHNLGVATMTIGRYSEAESMLLQALEGRTSLLGGSHRETQGSLYDLARLAALRGHRSEALDWLQQALRAGFKNVEELMNEPDLAPLHGDPDFDSIVAEMQKED